MLVSVVTPTRNSAPLIATHHAQVSAVLSASGYAYEIIYVDDGSADATPQMIRELREGDAGVRGIFLDRSYGQQTAVSVGYTESRGEVNVTIDVDLEIPASVIPSLVEEIRRGTDYVPVARVRRLKRGWVRDAGSWCFNRYMRATTGLDIRDFGSGAGALSHALLDRMKTSGIPHRGLKHLAGQLATSIVNMPVDEVPIHASSSYSLRGLFRAFWVEHKTKVGLNLPGAAHIRMTP